MAGENRRQFPRVVTHLRANGRVAAREIPLKIANLSLGGAFLETTEKIELGALVDLSLAHGGQTVTAVGRVAYAHRDGVGISFVTPPEDFRRAVAEIIEDHVETGANVVSRRRSERVQGRIAVLVQKQGGYDVHFTVDLSDHGALLAPEPTPAADELALMLSEHGVFECRAHVARRCPAGFGIDFVEAPTPMALALHRIITAFMGLRK
jgi:hypothetical protein